MVFYFLANIFTYQLFWCFFFVNDFYLQQWGREGLGLTLVKLFLLRLFIFIKFVFIFTKHFF